MPWEIGPIVRGLRRRTGTFALVMLEVASGFTTLTALLLASDWYRQFNKVPAGFDHRPLIALAVQSPVFESDPVRAARSSELRQEQILLGLRGLPQVRAAAPVPASVLDSRPNYPIRLYGRSGSGESMATGWTVFTSPALAEVLQLRTIEGQWPEAAAPAGGDRGSDLSGQLVLTRCLRDRLFPGGVAAVGRSVEAEDAAPAVVAAVIEDVVLGDPWNMQSDCLAIRFRRPGNERDARFLVRSVAGQEPQALAAIAELMGPSTPRQRVTVQPFDPGQAHRARMARGLVLTLAVFGLIVAVIALVGTFTVSSFLVRERIGTIGIRRALGATPRQIVRFFLVENTVVVLGGIAVGLVVSWGLFRLMLPLYPGLKLGWQPLLLTGMLLWIDATIAAWLPARRAGRTPPSTAGRGLR